jgi:hypothetical protein
MMPTPAAAAAPGAGRKYSKFQEFEEFFARAIYLCLQEHVNAFGDDPDGIHACGLDRLFGYMVAVNAVPVMPASNAGRLGARHETLLKRLRRLWLEWGMGASST